MCLIEIKDLKMIRPFIVSVNLIYCISFGYNKLTDYLSIHNTFRMNRV